MKVFISPMILLFITVSLLNGTLTLRAIIFVFPVEIKKIVDIVEVMCIKIAVLARIYYSC